jgi:hypothetical protein
LLTLWAVALVLLGGFLMAPHVVGLPAPDVGNRGLAALLAAHPSPRQNWRALHVLYQACGCSARVVQHLLERGARVDVAETVIYVHDADPAAAPALAKVGDDLRQARFGFEALTPAELARRYQVESAPLLLVIDPRGALRYSGGYTHRSGSALIQDGAVIDGLIGGRRVETLPVLGCAMSPRMQRAIDPLGLKYQTGDR